MMFINLVVLVLTVRKSYTKAEQDKGLRILGGEDGTFNKYPYIVRLETKVRVIIATRSFITMIIPLHSCSSTAITAIWTLTAAHCVPSKEQPHKLFIRYGTDRPSDKNATIVKVIEYKPHPSYRVMEVGSFPLKIENDVALLKTEPIIVPFYGKVSSVDFTSLYGKEANACGFGLTNGTKSGAPIIGDTLTLNEPLKLVTVMMMRCTDELKYATIHPPLCIARKCGDSVVFCPGDSGGPLLHSSGVVGVISLGAVLDCNLKPDKSNMIGIVTAIGPFIEWISDVINKI